MAVSTTKGLLVWLPLTKDLSNQGIAKTNITSNAIYDTSGKLGGCYKNGKISSGWGTGYNACAGLTAMCWCKFSDTTTNAMILSSVHNYPNNTRFYLGCYNGYFSGGLGNTGWGDSAANRKIETNKWYHICMTAEGTKWILYINGNKVLEKISSVSSVILDGDIYIGEKTGYYNDFRIYSYALSPQEIKEISRGLVGHWLGNDPWVQQLTSAHSNPMFNTRNDNGDWSHWASSGSSGTYGLTTNNLYVYPGFSLYAHKVQCSRGNYYICYTEQVFSGGYRSAQAIVKRSDGGIINSNVVTIGYNGGMDGGILTYIPLANGFYLIKREGFLLPDGNSSGSNSNLVSLTVRSGYTIYATCFYIENNKLLCSHIFNSTAPAFLSDISGRHLDLGITGDVILTTDTPRYDKAIIGGTPSSQATLSCSDFNFQDGPMTLSLWCKPVNPATEEKSKLEIIFGKFLYFTFLNYPYFLHGTEYKYRYINYWNDGNWHHLICHYDGNVCKIYIDGIEISNILNSSGNVNNTTKFVIYPRGYYLSDIRVYATALDLTAINELYTLKH